MNFKEKLHEVMKEFDISQSRLHELTGIGKSSISQYLSGKNEPTDARKKEIAAALGLEETFFSDFDRAAVIAKNNVFNVPVPVAAKLLGKSKEWVMQGLKDGVFPWGYAVKLTNWSYFISSVKFTEFTGIQIPAQ